jgi:predicted AlkP superfamily pyrophosphatase or phosphodiesterase
LTSVVLGLLPLLVPACAPGAPAEGPERTPKVLVIGIDGVRPDVLAEVETPHLDALAAEGVLVEDARTGFPSVSGPGWSSLLTGVWSDKHGVTDNEFTGKRYDLYPDFLTRIEDVRPELSTFAVADWPPLAHAEDGAPTLSARIDVRHALDGYAMGWLEADRRSVELAVEVLAQGDPDALFVYLGNPDETSHEHGSIGEEYRRSIREADAQVGLLIQAIRERPTFEDEDWLVLASTDHGRRADGGHGGDTPEERTIFFLASGPSVVPEAVPDSVFVVDVATTALAHLGIPRDPAWRLDGRAVALR